MENIELENRPAQEEDPALEEDNEDNEDNESSFSEIENQKFTDQLWNVPDAPKFDPNDDPVKTAARKEEFEKIRKKLGFERIF